MKPLRAAWHRVTPADYELHMQRIGQADANARLTESWLRRLGQARVLFAGAGPGQMLERISKDLLSQFTLAFSDVNDDFLALLGSRLGALGVSATLHHDDIEQTRIAGPFDAAAIVLVLEHVDWRAALAALDAWGVADVMIIVQENPASIATAVTPGQPMPETMQTFAGETPPHLIPLVELRDAMTMRGWRLHRVETELVLHGKMMHSCQFHRERS